MPSGDVRTTRETNREEAIETGSVWLLWRALRGGEAQHTKHHTAYEYPTASLYLSSTPTISTQTAFKSPPQKRWAYPATSNISGRRCHEQTPRYEVGTWALTSLRDTTAAPVQHGGEQCGTQTRQKGWMDGWIDDVLYAFHSNPRVKIERMDIISKAKHSTKYQSRTGQ